MGRSTSSSNCWGTIENVAHAVILAAAGHGYHCASRSLGCQRIGCGQNQGDDCCQEVGNCLPGPSPPVRHLQTQGLQVCPTLSLPASGAVRRYVSSVKDWTALRYLNSIGSHIRFLGNLKAPSPSVFPKK